MKKETAKAIRKLHKRAFQERNILAPRWMVHMAITNPRWQQPEPTKPTGITNHQRHLLQRQNRELRK